MSAPLRKAGLGLGALLVLAAVAVLIGRPRPSAPIEAAPDARSVDAPLIAVDSVPSRKIPGLLQVEHERNPGPELRTLLLGERVHVCRFEEQLRVMSCSAIDHRTQYGPHDEPDVALAETEPGAPAWLIAPKRTDGGVRRVSQQLFELEPEKRVIWRDLWVDAFVGADRRLAVIQAQIDEDVLLFGASDRLKRVKLPAAAGQTRLVGPWLLWPSDSSQLLVTRASGEALEPTQTLPGKYAGVGCHAKAGTRLLGESGGKLVLFVERQGRWSAIEGAQPRIQPLPSTDRYRFEQALTSLICTESGAIVIAQDAKRLDPRKSEIESCAGPDQCRYSLELSVVRCAEQRCVAEALRRIDLGAGGLSSRPQVLPLRDELLILWMTSLGVLRMTWLSQHGASPVRNVASAMPDYFVGAWARGGVAVALFTDRKRGVRAIRFGPDHESVSAVEQR